MKKILLSVVNFVLAIVAIFLTLAVFIQVVMTAGLLWLGSSKGQVWLQAQISDTLADSGYKISMTGLSYHSMQGVVVTKLVFGDKAGEILRADRVMAYVNPLALLHKQADISLKGTNLILSRLPDSEPSTDSKTALQPFALPDIYITSASISVSADRLELKEAVAGQDMVLAPTLNANVDFSKGVIESAATLKIGQPETKMPYLPENIDLKGKFSPHDLMVSLDDLKVMAAAYSLSAEGKAGLTETGPLDLRLSAKSDDLTSLAQQAGAADLVASLSGSVDKPLLNAEGKISLAMLADQGLGEIALKISTALENNMPMGNAIIETTYKDMPVKLAADYQYEDPVLHLFAIEGTAPDLFMTGAVDLDTAGLLASGQIDIKLDKIETYKEIIGVDAAGTAAARVSLLTDNDKQGVSANLKLTKGRYDAMSVAALDASALLKDISVPWPQAVDVKAKTFVLSPDATLKTLSLTVAENSLSSYLVALNVDGQAVKAFQLKGKADVSLIDNKPEAKNIDLTLTSTGASVSVAGSASESSLNLIANLKNLTAALVPVELPSVVQSMSASGQIRLTGSTAQPAIATEMDFSTLKLRDDLPAVKLAASGSYQNSLAKVNVAGAGEGIRALSATAEMPMSLSLYPFAFDTNESAALKGNAAFDLSGTAILAALLPPEHRFTGDLRGTVTLSVNGASYIYQPYGIRLQDLSLEAGLNDTQLRIQKISATDGERGLLSGSGTVDLKNSSQTAVSLKLSNYHLLNSRAANGMIGADLSLTGQNDGYVLGGGILLGPLDIIIPEQFKSTIPELNIVTDESPAGGGTMLRAIALNLNIVADDRVFVRGWGLDAEFGGALAATGTLDNPQLNGDFSSVRGRYEEFGKRFTLAKSVLRFQGSIPPSPYLDIQATTNAGDIVASVLLTGPVAKPKISFSSVPALPEDEILSRILFGRDMERITPFQAIQLAQTLQRFSGRGGGGLDPLGQIRSLTGLDDINVDTDADGETSVGVGKYLTDKVYLELQKGQGDSSGAASIQIEVTPNINVESKIGQDAQAGGGIFWKHDY